ncbi:UNVERIFIED_CONTAM: hypothetical protein HDU68_007967, partial [Siphonaria sp. JEL0065]
MNATAAAASSVLSQAQVQLRKRGRPPNTQRFGPFASSASTCLPAVFAAGSAKRCRTSTSSGHPNTAPNVTTVAVADDNKVSDDDSREDNGGSDVEDEFEALEDETAARLFFNEQQAIRQQMDYAHNQQKGTKIYLKPQEEYKTWCRDQGYEDEYVNETRMLVFLKSLQNRVLKSRGRRSTNMFQKKTSRTIRGKVTTIERRDKNGKVTYRHPDYESLVSAATERTLGHHSIKVYVNALVHLYFWQTADTPKNMYQYPRGPTIKSFLGEHKVAFSKTKVGRLDDAGLEDISMRLDKKSWRELSLELLKESKFEELAALHIDKQAVARHQLARDWYWKDAFLYTLEQEDIKNGDARSLYDQVNGKTRTEPQVSNRELFYKEKVLGEPKYGKMYKTLDDAMKQNGIISK